MPVELSPLTIMILLYIIKQRYNKEYQKENVLEITICSREFYINMNDDKTYIISFRTFIEYNDSPK